MIINSHELAGACPCGRTHDMVTRLVMIEQGCLARFEELTADLPPRRVAIYDRNTYATTTGLHPKADQEIVLDPIGLHANEISVEKVLSSIEVTELLIAVGSGTVHDITRYCAAQLGIPFISVPTAASVDGFCSTVAAMTWHGFKRTFPAVAPLLVIADLDVIVRAPIRLALSGAGDIFGKYIALADWQIGHLLTGEYICDRIVGMTFEAVKAVSDSCGMLHDGSIEAFEKLTYGLMLSGLAMQMTGNSRCASGAEHHISHLLELELPLFGKCNTLHGERVGVGTVLAAEEYHRIAADRPKAVVYTPIPADTLWQDFGDLTPSMLEENSKDCLAAVSPDVFNACYDEISEIIQAIPSPVSLRSLYHGAGLLASLTDLGINEARLHEILRLSPYIRNRLTLMKIRRMLDIAHGSEH